RYPQWQVTATVPAMAAHPPPTPSTYLSVQPRLPARYLRRRCGRPHQMICGENPLERCGDNLHMGCRRIRHTTCEHPDSVAFVWLGRTLVDNFKTFVLHHGNSSQHIWRRLLKTAFFV